MSPALEEESPNAPEYPQQDRRKSTTWKTFNFKRQLSKVDVKLKNTFAEKRGSIFYGAEEEPVEAISPNEDLEVAEECTEIDSPKKESFRPDNLVLVNEEGASYCPMRPPRGNKRKVKPLLVRTEIKDLRESSEETDIQQQPPTTSFMRRFSKFQLLAKRLDACLLHLSKSPHF